MNTISQNNSTTSSTEVKAKAPNFIPSLSLHPTATTTTGHNPTPTIDASPAALSTAAAVAAMNATQHPAIANATPLSNLNINMNTQPQKSNVPSAQQQQQQMCPTLDKGPATGAINQILPQQAQQQLGNFNLHQHQYQVRNVTLPQHQLNMNQLQFAPTTFQVQTKTTKPSIFTNMNLRRGKWTPEEERFANGLIEEFEKGTIQDCENGSTLRAFLSRKLHCAPMRISKKYAGKSIGKHVFLSRSSAPHSQQQLQDNSEKLRRLEFQFHMSLVQEGAAGLDPDSLNSMNQPLLTGTDVNPLLSGYNLALQQNQQIPNGTPMPCPVGPIPGVIPNNPELNAHNSGFAPWPGSSMMPGGNSISSNSSWQNASAQLQRSLFDAFKEAQSNALAPSPNATVHVKTQPSILGTSSSQDNSKWTTAKTDTRVVCAEKDINISNNVASTQMATSTLKQSEALKEGGINVQHASQDSMKNKELPGILSGFDSLKSKSSPELSQRPKIELNGDKKKEDTEQSTAEEQQNWLLETMIAIPSLDTLTNNDIYSTPFTSKSFDDLHQYLGNELNGSAQGKSGEKGGDFDMNYLVSGDDSAIVSSDAYAIFAQQSAMAVSKHSAYVIEERETRPSARNNGVTLNAKHEAERKVQSHASKTISAPINRQSQIVKNSTNRVAFNETNLQLHSEAVEELSRVDKNTTNNTDPSRNSSSLSVNIVSGSEQSADSSESSSRSGSGSGSGSDNASDNSDSASDEGNGGVNSMKKLENPAAKRQKLTVVKVEDI